MKLYSTLLALAVAAFVFPTQSHAAYQSSDPVLISYFRVNEFYDRGSTKRGVYEDRIRRLQEKKNMPEVTIPKTIREHMHEKKESERLQEKCTIYRDVVGRLRDAVLGAIPESSVYFVLSTTIEGIFDKVLKDCPYDQEAEEVEDVEEVEESATVDNKCEQYGASTRRRRVCEYNQSRNMPFLGGQYRR